MCLYANMYSMDKHVWVKLYMRTYVQTYVDSMRVQACVHVNIRMHACMCVIACVCVCAWCPSKLLMCFRICFSQDVRIIWAFDYSFPTIGAIALHSLDMSAYYLQNNFQPAACWRTHRTSGCLWSALGWVLLLATWRLWLRKTYDSRLISKDKAHSWMAPLVYQLWSQVLTCFAEMRHSV